VQVEISELIVVFLQRTLKRKITYLSDKHSFTPYPYLSLYSPTDRMTDRGTNQSWLGLVTLQVPPGKIIRT
jgi:hypothetical protein